MARNDVRVTFDPWDALQDGEGRGGEVDRFAPGLGVGQPKHAALPIKVLPFGVQYFPQASARQDEEPDRARGMRVNLRPFAFLVGRVLGVGVRLVDGPRNALRLCQPEGIPKSANFVGREEALSALLGIVLYTR